MYRLPDFLNEILHIDETRIVSDDIYCFSLDAEKAFRVNDLQEMLDCYSYTLVKEGRITLIYNEKEVMLLPGDLFIYSPKFAITVLDVSEDFEGICLIADEQATLDIQVTRNVIRTSHFPIVQVNNPLLHLNSIERQLLEDRMNLVIEYIGKEHQFKAESLRASYTMFLLDLLDIMEKSLVNSNISERTETIFIKFIRLLPFHFTEHHDVKFYADQLFITTTHLSRVVRQTTGRTVVDYIEQMLLMEASWLLQTSDLSISQIAARLHFSDQSSFGRFFRRLKGLTPKAYRMQIK